MFLAMVTYNNRNVKNPLKNGYSSIIRLESMPIFDFNLIFLLFFFSMKSNARRGRTSKMQPLCISKDPCITEEKRKLINWEGGGVGVCAPGFEGLKIINAWIK